MPYISEITKKYDSLDEPDLGAFESYLLEQYLAARLSEDDSAWFEHIMIEKHLGGEWHDREAMQVEERIAGEARLQQMKEAIRSAKEYIRSRRYDGFREKVMESLSEEKGHHYRYYYLAAASVIILFGILYFTGTFERSYTNGELFATYYEPMKIDLGVVRGDSDRWKQTAQKALLEGNSDSLVYALRMIITQDPGDNRSRLNLASVYMVTEQYGEAIAQYEVVEKEGSGDEKETARWHLALCRLKTGNTGQAKGLLETIADGNGKYAEHAREILKKMTNN